MIIQRKNLETNKKEREKQIIFQMMILRIVIRKESEIEQKIWKRIKREKVNLSTKGNPNIRKLIERMRKKIKIRITIFIGKRSL